MKTLHTLFACAFILLSSISGYAQCANVHASFTHVNVGGCQIYAYDHSHSPVPSTINWTYTGYTTVTHGPSMTHTFTGSGGQVCETILVNGVTCSNSCASVSCTAACANINPHFTYTGSNGVYTMTDSSFGVDTTVRYIWDYNGRRDTAIRTVATFPYNGTFTMREYVQTAACPNGQYYTEEINVTGVCPVFAPAWISAVSGSGYITFNDRTPHTSAATSYAWTFGDDSTGTGANPSHIYKTSGLFTICETVTEQGCTPYTHCDTLTVRKCQNLATSYNYTTDGNGNYTFADRNSGWSDTNYHFTWTFGDSTSATGTTVTHPYTYAATRSVCEVISNAYCGVRNICQNIPVGFCTPPVQNWTYTTNTNGFCNFTDASTGLTGNASYGWIFGDGTTGYSNTYSHVYAATGNYTVCEIINPNNLYCHADTLCRSIHVTVCPSISMSWSLQIMNSVGLVQFTDASSGQDGNATYTWTFGDGATGSGRNPSHTYTAAGSYIATETIHEPGCPNVSLSHWVNNLTICPVIDQHFSVSFSGGPGYVTFTDSSFGQAPNSTYSWSFGDNGTATGISASHYYSYARTFTVYENILQPGCAYSTKYGSVTIPTCGDPSFTHSDHGRGYVTFQDASHSASGQTTYSWDFGDGNSGTGQSPSNTYAFSGQYNVCETMVEPYCGTDGTMHCEQIYVNVLSTGISDIDANSVRVYPTPASDILHIEMGSAHISVIEIYSTLGQKVQTATDSYTDHAELNISTLPAGIYSLILRSGENTVHRQFTVSH